jgi:hypothetical protein
MDRIKGKGEKGKERKPYTSPKLTVYGQVEKITGQRGRAGADGVRRSGA